MTIKSDGDETVHSEKEHNQENIDTAAEENMEKINLANYSYDSLTIRGRYLDIVNLSNTGNDTM